MGLRRRQHPEVGGLILESKKKVTADVAGMLLLLREGFYGAFGMHFRTAHSAFDPALGVWSWNGEIEVFDQGGIARQH